jgi:hypothetical protein
MQRERVAWRSTKPCAMTVRDFVIDLIHRWTPHGSPGVPHKN